MSANPSPEHKKSFSRRELLQLFGVGAITSGLGFSRFSKPEPSVSQQDAISLPSRLGTQRSVVVVGGGLAGLSAAYELSLRGFSVTLLELAPQLGGKIASWTIDALGTTFTVEHGFHGFFPQYYNLRSMMGELQSLQNFRSLDFYSVIYKDSYKPEVFRPSNSAFPWNIVDLTLASPNALHWGLNLTKSSHWDVFREIAGFDASKSYARLDPISVSDWVAHGFPKGLFDLYFLPFAKSSLNAPDLLSAGELMQFFHFYFFGNPEGLAFEGTRQDMGTSVVQPIARSITQHGGTIHTDASVQGIHWSDGRITELSYAVGASPAVTSLTVRPLPIALEATGTPGTDAPGPDLYGDDHQVVALNSDRDRAISLTCTHQGCRVSPQADGSYLCPCHGARFAADGTVLKGPAQRNLSAFRVVSHRGDALELRPEAEAAHGALQTIRPDYVVMATDVPGLKQLFQQSSGPVPTPLQNQVDQLAIADPFAVARLWFDRDFEWDQSDFTSLSGYRLTDSITLYHKIQDEYIQWAHDTGGSVVELHAYCYKEKDFPDQDSLLLTFKQELFELVPELAQAKLLHHEVVNQKNFSGYPPNSYAVRPDTSTATSNLFFAGDWVRMPFPCGLMERAVSSGLLAANVILQREGLQRRPLLSVNPTGVLSSLTGGPTHEV